jgi:hypothetical protein
MDLTLYDILGDDVGSRRRDFEFTFNIANAFIGRTFK